MRIQDVMTAAVSFVRPDTLILEIARKMRDGDIGATPVVDQQIRRLPVVDREKRLVGVVALGDLALSGKRKAAGEALQEISQPASA